MKLAIASSGTGGHILPALAVSKAWRAKGLEILWYGQDRGLEAKIAKENDIPFHNVDAFGIRPISKVPKNLFNIAKSIQRARALLRQHKVDCIFSTGSYASFPTAVAGCLEGIPVIIHEQNTVLGLANKALMPFSKAMYLGMPVKGLPQSWVIGNPLVHPPIHNEGKYLLVFAGSQGSRFVNQELPSLLAKLKSSLPIVHIAGSEKESVSDMYKELGLQAEVYDFRSDMQNLYQHAKIVLCRGGAMSLAEITAYKIPAIIIPYRYATKDHQRKNAQCIAKKGGAIVIEEDTIMLESALDRLIHQPLEYEKMKSALDGLVYEDVSEKIVKGILEICAQALPH